MRGGMIGRPSIPPEQLLRAAAAGLLYRAVGLGIDEELPAEGRNGERDFYGEKRSNETHASTTGPDARLYKKAEGQTSKLCHMGHVVMENRHGLVVPRP